MPEACGKEAESHMANLRASDDMRQWLETLVKIESPSGHAEGIGQVMDVVAEVLGDKGAVSRIPTPAGPMMEISRGQGGALILAHADTVWPLGTLAEMPWREQGDWVYGPGSLDMKGGIAIAMAAIREIADSVPYTFLITPDEEVGSDDSREAIEDAARRSRLVLVLESGMPGGAVKVGRAGVGDYRLHIRGVESHAGLEPEKGASAIKELSHHIQWMEGLENKVLGTTLNVGVVEGGTRSNVVAGKAWAHIDVRVTTRSEMERIEATLSAPPRFDARCEVVYEGGFNRPPMEPTVDSQQWFHEASHIWRQATGQELAGVRVGGASDGNLTALLAPTMDGLGPVGQGAHARNEGVDWRYMEPRRQLVQELLIRAGRS